MKHRNDIKNMPQTIKYDTVKEINEPAGVHESMYQSYHILAEVKEMLVRGDSQETIIKFIEEMRE